MNSQHSLICLRTLYIIVWDYAGLPGSSKIVFLIFSLQGFWIFTEECNFKNSCLWFLLGLWRANFVGTEHNGYIPGNSCELLPRDGPIRLMCWRVMNRVWKFLTFLCCFDTVVTSSSYKSHFFEVSVTVTLPPSPRSCIPTDLLVIPPFIKVFGTWMFSIHQFRWHGT